MHSVRIHGAIGLVHEIEISVYEGGDVHSKSTDDEGYQKDDQQPERGFSFWMAVSGTSFPDSYGLIFGFYVIHFHVNGVWVTRFVLPYCQDIAF